MTTTGSGADEPGELERLRAECARLRRELLRSERSIKQLLRVAERSEAMAVQRKRAMLRAHDELRAHVDQLRAAKAAAEPAASAKGRFLATMSHELRTPLNGMVGSAELLLTTGLQPEQMALVELLHRSGGALPTIVNDVLDYSRIDAGRMPVAQSPFALRDWVHGVVALERQVAGDKRLWLATGFAAGLPAVVIGDDGRLRQVMMNLVTNALKFTSTGGVTVRVAPTGQADMIEFAVSDTGIGIPAVAQRQLFEAFAQAHTSTTRRCGGTGLGLAISRRLLRLMGGDIQVHSIPGEGTTMRFTCRLPAAVVLPIESGEAVVPSDQLARGHALLVDDNSGNRLLLRRMLERIGWSCDEAVDGVDAVSRVSQRPYHVVLMDCSMPVLDGYDATRATRGLPAPTSLVSIVAVTATALPEDEARCREVGMDGYPAKPLRKQALVDAIERLVPTAVALPVRS